MRASYHGSPTSLIRAARRTEAPCKPYDSTRCTPSRASERSRPECQAVEVALPRRHGARGTTGAVADQVAQQVRVGRQHQRCAIAEHLVVGLQAPEEGVELRITP